MPPEQAVAFAPGRVNLIGEHTDYNAGLALPFAIAEGITVESRARRDSRIVARAHDLDEQDDFTLDDLDRPIGEALPAQAGWRVFVRGAVAELTQAGFKLQGADLEISGDLAQGAGLSSSAALEVSLCLALLALQDSPPPDRRTLAELCSRVERNWVGARTGLLDQLASLYGEPDHALLIDFRDLTITPIPLALPAGWRLVVLDSGEPHALADSAYNERRAECAQACTLLGVTSLRETTLTDLPRLPSTLANRAAHVLSENARVKAATTALQQGDLNQVGQLLTESHTSLRDLYASSTPAVERTVERLLTAGAAGARMVGGGFGGHVLALFPPNAEPPPAAHEVTPSQGARLLDD